jgi:hypothetical protein
VEILHWQFGTYLIFKRKEFTGLNIFIISGFLATGLISIGNILYPSLNLGDRTFLYLGLGGLLMLIYLLPKDIISKLKDFRKPNKTTLKSALIIIILCSPIIGSVAYHYNQGIYFQPPQNEDRYIFTIQHVNSATIYNYWDNHGLIINNIPREGNASGELINLNLIDFNPEFPILDKNGTVIVVADSTEFMYIWDEMTDDYEAILSYSNKEMNKVYSSPGNSVWYIDL